MAAELLAVIGRVVAAEVTPLATPGRGSLPNCRSVWVLDRQQTCSAGVGGSSQFGSQQRRQTEASGEQKTTLTNT